MNSRGIGTDSGAKLQRSRMIRNRWRKTVTLINNPTLVLERIHSKAKVQGPGYFQTSIDDDDSMGDKTSANGDITRDRSGSFKVWRI